MWSEASTADQAAHGSLKRSVQVQWPAAKAPVQLHSQPHALRPTLPRQQAAWPQQQAYPGPFAQVRLFRVRKCKPERQLFCSW